MMDIATPVMAACLMVTTLEVNDTSHSTVAYQELKACAPCNSTAKDGKSLDCPEPSWMAEARKMAAILNKPGQKSKTRKDARR